MRICLTFLLLKCLLMFALFPVYVDVIAIVFAVTLAMLVLSLVSTPNAAPKAHWSRYSQWRSRFDS